MHDAAGPPPTGEGPRARAGGPDGPAAPSENRPTEGLGGLVPLKSEPGLPMGEGTRHGWCATQDKDGPLMIIVTRRNGTRFGLNPDLIERVDETPDTVVLLVSGSRYVVTESLDEVSHLISEGRAEVLALAEKMRHSQLGARPEAGRAALRAIRTRGE